MNRVYEKPEFKFQELSLSERVADECWGLGHAYLDLDNNGIVSPGDLEIPFGSGCQGASAAQAMNAWFVDHGYKIIVTANVCNTKDDQFVAGGDVVPAES